LPRAYVAARNFLNEAFTQACAVCSPLLRPKLPYYGLTVATLPVSVGVQGQVLAITIYETSWIVFLCVPPLTPCSEMPFSVERSRLLGYFPEGYSVLPQRPPWFDFRRKYRPASRSLDRRRNPRQTSETRRLSQPPRHHKGGPTCTDFHHFCSRF